MKVELLERDDELRLLDRTPAGGASRVGLDRAAGGGARIGTTSPARLSADGPTTPTSGGAAPPPHEIQRALLEVLGDRPLLLVVDDLQWADEATIDLLRFLRRRVSGCSRR